MDSNTCINGRLLFVTFFCTDLTNRKYLQFTKKGDIFTLLHKQLNFVVCTTMIQITIC